MTRNSIIYRQSVIIKLAHAPVVRVHLLLKQNVSEEWLSTHTNHKIITYKTKEKGSTIFSSFCSLKSTLLLWFCLKEASKCLQFKEMSCFRAEAWEVLNHISDLTSVCSCLTSTVWAFSVAKRWRLKGLEVKRLRGENMVKSQILNRKDSSIVLRRGSVKEVSKGFKRTSCTI